MRRSPAVWFASYGMSLLGAGIATVVMPLLVLERTGDVLAAGVLATVTTAAAAATGLLSGLLVDRIDRRVVSVVSDLLSALSLAALPVVDALWGLDMTAFLVLGLIGAVIRVPGMTAQESVLPVLARLGDVRPRAPGPPDRHPRDRRQRPAAGRARAGRPARRAPRAVARPRADHRRHQRRGRGADPRARPAGRRRRPAGRTQPGGAVRRAVTDLVVSWRFLVRHRLVLGATLVGATFVAVLSSLQSTLMPAYFTAEDLPALTGLTLSAIAAGSIAGSALYAATTGRVRRRTWFVIGMTGTLVGFVAVGSMASPWLVLAGAALVGLTNAPASAVLGVLTVEATPDAMRGRVLGAQNTVMLSAPALTSAPLAAVAATAGLPAAGVVIAALAGLTAIVALVAPAFRSLDEPPAVPEPTTAVVLVSGGGVATAPEPPA